MIAALRTQIIESQARPPSKTDGRTHWYALSSSPRLLFEHVIQHLRRFVPGEHAGAEWWFRATTTDTDFPFHFDRDEAIRDTIVSPDLATILYLSNAGGPTVILDAKPKSAAPKAGLAIHPRAGRFGMFPGELLHGVVPGAPSRWPRVTLLVNWWRTEPRMERSTERFTPTSAQWRAGATTPVKLEAIDPTRLLSKAAWRDVIANQTGY